MLLSNNHNGAIREVCENRHMEHFVHLVYVLSVLCTLTWNIWSMSPGHMGVVEAITHISLLYIVFSAHCPIEGRFIYWYTFHPLQWVNGLSPKDTNLWSYKFASLYLGDHPLNILETISKKISIITVIEIKLCVYVCYFPRLWYHFCCRLFLLWLSQVNFFSCWT